MGIRVGLYGGSFDPIHHGHLIVAREVAERLDLDRVIFLPAASPPHKTGERLADPSHRAEMVRRAIDREPRFEFDDYDLARSGPSYTIDTLAHFREKLGSKVELYWIIGSDSLAELPGWHRVCDLIDACKVVTAVRTGWQADSWKDLVAAVGTDRTERLKGGVLETPVVQISSTDIRERSTTGRSIRYLVPQCVAEFIAEHGLYASSTPTD